MIQWGKLDNIEFDALNLLPVYNIIIIMWLFHNFSHYTTSDLVENLVYT